MKLLLATANRGKIREIADTLAKLPFEIIGLGDLEGIVPAEETGNSCLANAKIKAKAYHEQTGLLTFAEDSGLEVDYLNGAPGHLSARFAGEDSADADNVAKLLRELKGVMTENRKARFLCVIAIADGKRIRTATGKCEGRIAWRASGTSGFGYDPVFIPKGYRTTFARLGLDVKNSISHRAHALRKAKSLLEGMAGENAE